MREASEAESSHRGDERFEIGLHGFRVSERMIAVAMPPMLDVF